MRGIDRIDEDEAPGLVQRLRQEPGQDPYFVHYYRVNFDGTGLVALTEGDGNHTVQYLARSPYLIDTYSRVDMAPVHELRRVADGKLVCKLEEADISALKASGWKPPEVFVAKGRDGKTDIWGIICRPKDFDPSKKYPVIESIYAGPQGSFVPKTFSPARRSASLTDLGFIVVQIDGMGTANRSKAFHDVCWKNLKDAGFPDRILWHKAAAKKYPEIRPDSRRDLRHVGGRPERDGRRAVPSGVLQGRGLGLRLPRQPDGQGLVERAVDGLPGRPAVRRVVQHRQRPPAPGQAAADRRRDGHQRPARVDHAARRRPDQGRQGLRLLVVPNANHGMGGAYGQRRMRRLLRPASADESANRPPRSVATPYRSRTDEPERIADRRDAVALDLEDVEPRPERDPGVIERYRSTAGASSDLPAGELAEPRRAGPRLRRPVARPAREARLRLPRPGRPGRLRPVQELPRARPESDQPPSERAAEAAPLVPFAREILDLDEAGAS